MQAIQTLWPENLESVGCIHVHVDHNFVSDLKPESNLKNLFIG